MADWLEYPVDDQLNTIAVSINISLTEASPGYPQCEETRRPSDGPTSQMHHLNSATEDWRFLQEPSERDKKHFDISPFEVQTGLLILL